jgi:hypothetical protein
MAAAALPSLNRLIMVENDTGPQRNIQALHRRAFFGSILLPLSRFDANNPAANRQTAFGRSLAVFLTHPDTACGLGQVATLQVLASDAKTQEAVFGSRLLDGRAGFLDDNEARLIRKAAFVNLAILNRAAGLR